VISIFHAIKPGIFLRTLFPRQYAAANSGRKRFREGPVILRERKTEAGRKLGLVNSI
jgi:hypothetical protein